MYLAVGLAPNEPAAAGTKGKLACSAMAQQGGILLKNALQFSGREIGIQSEAGFVADGFLKTCSPKGSADFFGAPILPNNGWVDGRTGLAMPQHSGFTLIGDANGGDGWQLVGVGRTHLL